MVINYNTEQEQKNKSTFKKQPLTWKKLQHITKKRPTNKPSNIINQCWSHNQNTCGGHRQYQQGVGRL